MKGCFNTEYFQNTDIQKPLAEIYEDFDQFTYEIFEDEVHSFGSVNGWVIVPPVHFQGQFLKGIYVSTSMDLVISKCPQIQELFYTIASSRGPGFPWSKHSDALMSTFDNPHRNEWFRQFYPERSHKLMLPFEHEFEFTNEYHAAPPSAYVDRDIDVLCIGRLSEQKNLPLLAQAGNIYRKKYGAAHFKMVFVIGKEFGENLQNLTESEKNQLHLLQLEIEKSPGNFELHEKKPFDSKLFEYHCHSKISTIGSLVEGKCRTIIESMCCNTPVVVFEQMNQFNRGPDPCFTQEAGLMIPLFDAESIADTWHQVIINQGSFQPRKYALERFGRRNYVEQVASAVGIYQDIPSFATTGIFDNTWLNSALHANYHYSLHDFTYNYCPHKVFSQGLNSTIEKLNTYFDLFGLPSAKLFCADEANQVVYTR